MNVIRTIKYVLGSNRTSANYFHCSQLKKKFLQLQNKCRTSFLDSENMGKDTKVDFLSQILRKLWGTEYSAHLAQADICVYDRKLAQGCWGGTFLILVHMICQVNDVKYDMQSKYKQSVSFQ